MKTLLWLHDDKLAIVVHSKAAPTDREWDAYLAAMPRGDQLLQSKTIVYSLGGGPNGAQRSRLVQLLRAGAPPAALLTASALMHGIGTAVSWFIRTLKVFSLNERAAAFQYLDLSADEVRRANATIDRFVSELTSQDNSAHE
jgi:hypothetical protein